MGIVLANGIVRDMENAGNVKIIIKDMEGCLAVKNE